jgi:hypothetical protein
MRWKFDYKLNVKVWHMTAVSYLKALLAFTGVHRGKQQMLAHASKLRVLSPETDLSVGV